MEDCAHFHYEAVELSELKVSLAISNSDKDKDKGSRHDSTSKTKTNFSIIVSCHGKWWSMGKTFAELRIFDQALHKCVYDRKFSKLLVIADDGEKLSRNQIHLTVSEYFLKFSQVANHRSIICSTILSWLQLDNHGNHLVAGGNAPINIQAVAAAQTIKAYTKQAPDELSLIVGDLLSLISMEGRWWRGKKEFEVGFFPAECVELITTGSNKPIAKLPPVKPVLEKKGKAASSLKASLDMRPSRLSLKRQGIFKERLFGCDLGEHLQNVGRVGELPVILKACVDFIESRGPVEGLYRLSGSTSRVQKLRNEFDANKAPDLTAPEYQMDTHSLCSLLKIYFRELPNPLFTYSLYDKFIVSVGQLANSLPGSLLSRDDVASKDSLAEVSELLCQLPPAHYLCAAFLMRHLAKIADQYEQTRMDCKNLAIVWAPNLLRPQDADNKTPDATILSMRQQAIAVEFFIHNASILFEQSPITTVDENEKKLKRSSVEQPKHKVAPPVIPIKSDKKEESTMQGDPPILVTPDMPSKANKSLPTLSNDDLPPPPFELLKVRPEVPQNKTLQQLTNPTPMKLVDNVKPPVPPIKTPPIDANKPPLPAHKTIPPVDASKPSVPAHKTPPAMPPETSKSLVETGKGTGLIVPKPVKDGRKSPTPSPIVHSVSEEHDVKNKVEHRQTFGKIMGELEKKMATKIVAPPSQPPQASKTATFPRSSNKIEQLNFDQSAGDVWIPRANSNPKKDKDGPPADKNNKVILPVVSGRQTILTKDVEASGQISVEREKPKRLISWPGQMDSKVPMTNSNAYDQEDDDLDVMIESSDA